MLVIDAEMSGLDPKKNSIVSLGALDLDNPTNRFYAECRIWDGAEYNEESLAICGFTVEEITNPDKMTEGELIRNFMGWSEDLTKRTFCGQNVSFDRMFAQAAAHRANLDWNFAHRTIDTHSLCWMHMVKRGLEAPVDEEHRRSALNLDSILNYSGIPEEPQPHNALTGALCHAEVASRLLYDRKLLPEFEQFGIPWLS